MDSWGKEYPRKVFLIVDMHSMHTSRKTTEWIKEFTEDIEERTSKTRSFFREIQKQPYVVKGYFMEKNVKYST